MSFGIMSHSALYRIRTYVIQDCVVQRNVVQRVFVWRKVVIVRPTVRVSYYPSIHPADNNGNTYEYKFIQTGKHP